MKFAGSQFEERYNNYWNDNIVVIDNAIRSSMLGYKLFDKSSNVGTLIKSYQKHVLNMLANLDRQAAMFGDKDCIQQYRQNTIDQTLEDFNVYAAAFPTFKNAPADFIEALSPKKEETSEPNVFSVL